MPIQDSSSARALARVALALIATIALLIVILSSRSLQTEGIAQPAPTGTQIEIVNPHLGTSDDQDERPDLSTKEDADELYHFVTWVSNPPAGAVAEFQLRTSTDAYILGTTTESPDRSTFDLFDDLCVAQGTGQFCPPDGNYTLRVGLFTSSGGLIDEDTMNVEVNNADPTTPPPTGPHDPAARAETVEITYPEVGDELGYFFDKSGRSTFVIDGVASAATTFVKGFYSVSPRGSEPQWSSCGNYVREQDEAREPGGSQADSEFFRVRCSLPSGTPGSQLRAVALTANDTPDPAGTGNVAQPQFDDASDAHTISEPYAQIATTVSLDDNDETGTPGSCVPVTATVVDQRNRHITNISVDVHAVGPVETLRFRDDGSNQAPDSGGHAADTARNSDCSDNSGAQGNHEQQGELDVKHMETTSPTGTSGGTDEHGEYTFRLWVPTGTGGSTRYAVFADPDDDDLYCSAEADQTGRIDWGGLGASPAAPAPQTNNCASPQETPSPGASGTSTSTGSPRPRPSGSDDDETPDPSGSTTTTTTTTTTSTSTTGGGGATRRVATSLGIRYGRGAFKGKAVSSARRCETGRTVKVKKKRDGRDRTIGQDSTTRQGRWSLRQRRANGKYYAVVLRKVFTANNGNRVVCRADKSKTITV